jgi:hypothetical protein
VHIFKRVLKGEGLVNLNNLELSIWYMVLIKLVVNDDDRNIMKFCIVDGLVCKYKYKYYNMKSEGFIAITKLY